MISLEGKLTLILSILKIIVFKFLLQVICVFMWNRV